jgi:hypothetical protein
MGDLASALSNSGIDLDNEQAVNDFIAANAPNRRIAGRKVFIRAEALRLRGQ